MHKLWAGAFLAALATPQALAPKHPFLPAGINGADYRPSLDVEFNDDAIHPLCMSDHM